MNAPQVAAEGSPHLPRPLSAVVVSGLEGRNLAMGSCGSRVGAALVFGGLHEYSHGRRRAEAQFLQGAEVSPAARAVSGLRLRALRLVPAQGSALLRDLRAL